MTKLLNILKIAVPTLIIVFAISYASAQWTPAPGTPPNCPTGTPGCDAPLNVGPLHQSKLKGLDLNTTLSSPDTYGLNVWGISRFFGNLEVGSSTAPSTIKIVDGNQALNKVLTSDANGVASWQVAPTGGGGSVTVCDANPFQTLQDTGNNSVYENTSGSQLIVVVLYSETIGTSFFQDSLRGYIGISRDSLNEVAYSRFSNVGNDARKTSITFVVPPNYHYKVLMSNIGNPPNVEYHWLSQAWKVCGGGGSATGSVGGGYYSYSDGAIRWVNWGNAVNQTCPSGYTPPQQIAQSGASATLSPVSYLCLKQ